MHFHRSVVALLLLLLLLAALGGEPVAGWGFMKESLFDHDPGVVDLESTALRHVHANANRCPWFVLIYDAMCGHCRAFAPKLSEFVARRREQLLQAHDRKSEGPERVPVLFAAVNCAASPSTCRTMNVSTVPSLFAAEPDFALRELAEAEHLKRSAQVDASVRWRAITDRNNLQQEVDSVAQSVALTPREISTCTGLAEYLRNEKLRGIEAEGGVAELARNPRPRIPHPPNKNFKPETQLFQQDVAGAFFVTMWHEVSMAAVSEEGVAALKAFLTVADRALPALQARPILAGLGDTEERSATLLESHIGWKEHVERAGIPFHRGPDNSTAVAWRTCLGSSWRERGLPCGLWTLYHALVANAQAGEGVATLKAIRSYVDHFFVCYECRRHFGSLAFALGDDASDDDAVLWLWRAHNQVNARLAVEHGSSDPAVPKILWPSKHDCPECRGNSGFDDAAVVRYLRGWYAWGSIAVPPPFEPAQPAGMNSPSASARPAGGARSSATEVLEGVAFIALLALLAYVKIRLVPVERPKVHTL